jgi:colicin import membrane protein
MSTPTITFVALAPRQFVPVIDGFAVVKAPSIKGNALMGDSPWAVLTTDDERAVAKTEARVATGRWAAAVKLTRAGNLPKKPKFDADGLASARTERKAELDAASEARKAEAKAAKAQAKAEAKAAKQAESEPKSQATKPAPAADNAALLNLLTRREEAASMIADGLPAALVAAGFGVDEATLTSVTDAVFASMLDDEDEAEVEATADEQAA